MKMGEGELKLLGTWSSSYVMTVRMILEEKGLCYEYHEQDLSKKSDLLL
jgi:glutathione S-transferase